MTEVMGVRFIGNDVGGEVGDARLIKVGPASSEEGREGDTGKGASALILIALSLCGLSKPRYLGMACPVSAYSIQPHDDTKGVSVGLTFPNIPLPTFNILGHGGGSYPKKKGIGAGWICPRTWQAKKLSSSAVL